MNLSISGPLEVVEPVKDTGMSYVYYLKDMEQARRPARYISVRKVYPMLLEAEEEHY